MALTFSRPSAVVMLATLAMSSGSSQAQNSPSPRQRIAFNDAWRFVREDPADGAGKLSYEKLRPWLLPVRNPFLALPASRIDRPEGHPGSDVSYVTPRFDDHAWRLLALPHDWGIEGPFDQALPGKTGKLPWSGVAWYRKHFIIPPAAPATRYTLEIDGAMSHAVVWLNGRLIGGWPYGYASFQLDLTEAIQSGENVLSIRLDNRDNSSRWYPGGGIYRDVSLLTTGPVRVGQWGTVVTTPQIDADKALISLATRLENHLTQAADVEVTTTLLDGDTTLLTTASQKLQLTPGSELLAKDSLTLEHPKLWDLTHPHLYRAVTRVSQNGRELDRYETPFGIRTLRFTVDNGFLLNGQRVTLRGVCNHHDLGALGSAFNLRAAERQLEILKSMGVNALRTSHNPPAPQLLDLCDRMGILVMDEFTDTWTIAKTKNGYATLFADWSEADLRALIRRDRNHPSVIFWSIGNEVGEQRNPKYHPVAQRLTGIVREEDSTRLVTAGCDDPNAGTNGFQKTVDVFGYNYKPHLYSKFRQVNPDQPLYGSETASCISTRGEYRFPVSDDKSQGQTGFQMSSYDLYAPGWASPPDTEFMGQDANPFVAGEFVWTGFDYLGEPTPFNNDLTVLTNFHTPEDRAKAQAELARLGKIQVPSRSSYFGIVDLAGFPKDRFYLYQSRWRSDLPMAHILPHWNWPERLGEVTPVHVYTSGDQAELFLNGKSLGRRSKVAGGPEAYRLRWNDVVYQPGELKVIAYKNGQIWAQSQVSTTGPAAAVTLTPDRATISSSTPDLSFVTVSLVDAQGRNVPRTHNRLEFEISGPGEIVAVDNGDPTSLESFQSKSRKAFNGLALVVVRALKSGTITLGVKSEGLTGTTTQIQAR